MSKPALGIRTGHPNEVGVISLSIDAAYEGNLHAAGGEEEFVEAIRVQIFDLT